MRPALATHREPTSRSSAPAPVRLAPIPSGTAPATRGAAAAVIVAALLVGCGGDAPPAASPVATIEPSAAASIGAPPASAAPEVVYAWSKLTYDFRTPEEASAFESRGIVTRTALAGVEVDRRGNVYVTTPRWLSRDVPATLSQVVVVDGKPVLRPFPSWEANSLDDPRGLRNVLGVEVDSRDRMWILDMGWVDGDEMNELVRTRLNQRAALDGRPQFFDPIPADGAQKLVVIDLRDGKELARYAIPDDVANRKTSFLNDLAVDERRAARSVVTPTLVASRA